MGQGKDNAKKYLIDNPNISKEIETKIKNKVTNTTKKQDKPKEKEILKK